jgi:two-component system response regulator PrrA
MDTMGIADAPRSRKILVVEDDETTRALLCMGLERSGFQVTGARHGQEAQQLVAHEMPDALVVDVNMPLLDGLGFMEWFRREVSPSVPAVIFSSSTLASIAQRSRELGATRFLSKPFQMPTLLQELRSLGI